MSRDGDGEADRPPPRTRSEAKVFCSASGLDGALPCGAGPGVGAFRMRSLGSARVGIDDESDQVTEGYLVDALALRGDEGRGTLR